MKPSIIVSLIAIIISLITIGITIRNIMTQQKLIRLIKERKEREQRSKYR